MTRVHRTTVSLALTRASLLGLHGHLILAAHHDDRTYTLLVTDGEVTQLATGRLTPSGREHVTLTPALLECDGLAHGRIPRQLVLPLPPESEEASRLATHARVARPPTAAHVQHALRRHDPHHHLRSWRDRAGRRAQAHEDLECGSLTLHGQERAVRVTPAGLVLEDGTVLSPDILDTL